LRPREAGRGSARRGESRCGRTGLCRDADVRGGEKRQRRWPLSEADSRLPDTTAVRLRGICRVERGNGSL